MVIAALASFAALLIAWILAPGEVEKVSAPLMSGSQREPLARAA